MSDDLSNDYLQRRDLVASNTAADELLLKYGARRGAEQQVAEAPANGKPPIEPKDVAAGGAIAAAAAVGKDIAKGSIEAPRAIVGGVRDAYQSAINLAGSVGDWVEEKTNLGVIKFGDGGIDYLSREELDKSAADGNPVPRLSDKMVLPEVKDPESVTGSMVKGISQFLTGFKVAGKFMKGAQPATKAGAYLKSAAQGAVADFGAFDGHDKRLSDLVQQFPALQNPVTEFLSSDESDSEAEGRFKNAIEGLGLGIVTDGLGLALKSMKKAAQAKRLQVDLDRVAGGHVPVEPEIPDGALDVLGREGDDLIATGSPAPNMPEPPKEFGERLAKAISRQSDDITPETIADATKEPETYINFARIDTPDDVKNVMQRMADSQKPAIDSARRGEKMSFKQMELNAEQVNAFDTLMSRRVGDPMNAEQSIAARQLWASSADKLAQTARLAASEPSEANLFAFRKMMAVHQTIQNEVVAARTETARALASWRIPAGTGAERFREIDGALQQSGGPEVSRQLALRISALAENGMIHELDSFVQKSAYARTRDAVMEAWINALLSGPKTHLVNMMSNTSVVFQQMYERGTAAKIASLLGDEGSVQAGEATAQFFGMVNGLKDAFRYAGKTAMTGESGFGLGKVDLPERAAISSESLGIANGSWLGKAVDTFGAAARVPTRALAASDEFFKTIGYRMELNALALRQANQEVAAGMIEPDMLKARIADILENPPSSIKLSAIDQAAYQTFTQKTGPLASKISSAANEYPALRIIVPFVRTPANIMKYTFERTPLAPLMKGVRADIAAGGSRRDLAMARIATGTATMMVAADMAMNEQITGKGPADRSQREAMLRQGWQPYSVRVGDRYYAYNRLDPIGATFGLAADMTEILANEDYGIEREKEIDEVMIATTMSIANNVMSKTYLSGLSEFFEAMSDPQRYGEGFFQRLAGSAVPTAVAEVARANDPYMREAQSMLDAMRKRIPGLSDDLPPRRNLWGEPVSYQSGLGKPYDMFSPIYSRAEKATPIDEEILRLEANITPASRKTSFDGVTIDLSRYPEAYSRYVELSGNELKHPAWNMGAKDFLNAVVGGKHPLSPVYKMRSDGPDGGKSDYIKKTLNSYREMSRKQLLQEFPDLKAEYDAKQREKRMLKLG